MNASDRLFHTYYHPLTDQNEYNSYSRVKPHRESLDLLRMFVDTKYMEQMGLPESMRRSRIYSDNMVEIYQKNT